MTQLFPDGPLLLSAILVLLCAPAPAMAQAAYPTPVEGDFLVKDFRFESGETLPEVKLHSSRRWVTGEEEIRRLSEVTGALTLLGWWKPTTMQTSVH